MNEVGQTMVGSALKLAGAVIVAVAILTGVYALTRERIVEQQREAERQSLNQVLPPGGHDNDPLEDVILVSDPALGGPGVRKVHRARRAGAPVAVVLPVTAPNGYNGPIELLVGIRYDGRLSGVRVTSHRETPGLGNQIDLAVDDWILVFAGRSLGDPPVEGWAVRRDGGEFDQFTGATITPRAVVAAVRQALEYFEANRETLFR